MLLPLLTVHSRHQIDMQKVVLVPKLAGNWLYLQRKVRDAASLNYAEEERDRWECTHLIPPSNILAATCQATRFGQALRFTPVQLVIRFSRGRGSKEDGTELPRKGTPQLTLLALLHMWMWLLETKAACLAMYPLCTRAEGTIDSVVSQSRVQA